MNKYKLIFALISTFLAVTAYASQEIKVCLEVQNSTSLSQKFAAMFQDGGIASPWYWSSWVQSGRSCVAKNYAQGVATVAIGVAVNLGGVPIQDIRLTQINCDLKQSLRLSAFVSQQQRTSNPHEEWDLTLKQTSFKKGKYHYTLNCERISS